MGFEEIKGQDAVVGRIVAGLREDRFPSALTLYGPEGIGKTFMALLLTRALTCPSDRTGCGTCPSCRKIRPTGCNHPDVRRISPIGKEIRIQQIRELARQVQVHPLEGKRRVFLLEPADRMTPEASNALLKSLEEPPPRSAILLVTPAYHSLLPTIRSRCQAIRLPPVGKESIRDFLVKERHLSGMDAELVASLSEGRIARAATFDLPGFRQRRESLLAMIQDLQGRHYGSAVIHHAEQHAQRVEELNRDLEILLILFRDIACLVHAGEDAPIANRDLLETLWGLADRYSHRSHHLVGRIEETRRDLRRNVNRYLSMEVLLFDLAGPGRTAEPGNRRSSPLTLPTAPP